MTATPRLFSIFDQANLGTSLQLSNSNQVVTTIAGGLTVNRIARCLYAQDTFLSNCEWMVYGTGSITNLAYVGIVDASAVTTKYVGEDTHGYGFNLSDGKLYNNGSAVATFTACAKNDIIGMAFNPLDLSLTFWQNGNLLGVYTLPSSGPWYPACSIGSTTAGDLSVFFNAGLQAFSYPLANASGWWTPLANINPVRLASEDFTALTTDSIPNAIFDGVIDAASSMQIVRSVSFWPWRTSAQSVSGGQSYGSITIDDPLEKYAALQSLDTRDAPFKTSRVLTQDNGGSVDDEQILCNGVLDRVDTAGDFQKTVYVKDAMAILDQPLQRSLFLPNADASAIGRPLPIIIGCARSVPGILTKSTAPQVFQYTDSPIAQIGDVRLAGKSKTIPTDCTLTSDFRGLSWDATGYPNGPQGKQTVDISTVGGSVASLTTILLSTGLDYGDFTNGALYTSGSDLATYWDTGGSSATIPTLEITGTDPVYPYPRLEFGPEGGSGAWTYIKSKTAICLTGHTYVAEVFVEASAPVPQNTSMHAYIYAGVFQASGQLLQGDAIEYNPHIENTLNQNSLTGKTYLTFTNTTGSNQPFKLGYQSNNWSGPFGEGLAKIKYVKLYDVGNATSFVNLTGTTLEDFLRTCIETEGGLTASAWRSSDAAAIDAATGYTSLGAYFDSAVTIRNACQLALDSCGADFVVLRTGEVGVVRLVDPGTITSSGTIDESVILGPLRTSGSVEQGITLGSQQDSMIAVTPDLAPGLTTKMGARRNWSPYSQGDFGSTSLTDATNSLRAALTQPYQSIAASGAQLSRSYLYAQQAALRDSLFDSLTDAQTEIDRVCALYTVLRYFYAVPVKSDRSDSYEIGQAWNLQYPRYGLSAGKPVLIVGITEDPINEQLTLICWG